MGDIGVDAIAALAAVSFLAGFVDSIAGGGGLLTVPALLLAGLDPAQAIATNKVQGSVAAASAAYTFARKGLIEWRRAWGFTLVAFASSIAGALCVRFLPRPVLDGLIPLLLVAIALYFALSRKVKDEDAHARLSGLAFGLTAPVAIGFYDGIFGPGAGSFYMLAFVTLLGYGVVRATAHTKVVNFASSIAGALCVRFLPRPVLDGLIPLLLVAIALYFALSRRVKDEDAHARLSGLAFGLTAPVAIGFYDGIFGPARAPSICSPS